MVEISQTVLIKLLTSGIGLLVRGKSSSLFSDKEIEDEIFAKANLEFILEQHLDEIDALICNIKSPYLNNTHSISTFFKYPEIENIVRQIYSSIYQKQNAGISSLKDIEHEFNLILATYFDLEPKITVNLSKKLFDVLLEACDESAKAIMLKSPEIAALGAESAYRDQLILEQLKQVKENISLLSENKIDIKEIHIFNEKYRKLLQERSKHLRSAAYDGNTRKPIDEIYVCPNFAKIEDSTDLSSNLTYDELLTTAFRIVLLGDPGTGKSTFTTKISYDLTLENKIHLFNGREMTPFIVTLREYQMHNKEHGHSILEFIEHKLNSSFQITSPKGAIEYLLLNGYLMVIFDGLDELLDINQRENIRDQIESFCTNFPAVPLIVTSRKIGYANAALDFDLFETYELKPFNLKQIEDYVHKWFNLDSDLAEDTNNKQALAFLKESNSINDIRSNSLMLSLLCNIYKQENYIPENRPKVYQKCADMLFEKWDKHRGIRPSIIIPDSKVKPLISYLAFWIFGDSSLQQGVSEVKLVNKASDYLYDFYEDIDHANMAAEDFIDFCKGRAWVFTDTGSTATTSLYQFTHRTFLEYFASDWLTRKYSTTNELIDLLLPKIKQGEWDVVSQLAFQIRGESIEGATEELLSSLLDELDECNNEDKYNLLSFTIRSLEFMTVKPKVIRDLVTSYFEHLIENGLNIIDKFEKGANIIPEINFAHKNQKLILDLQKIGNRNIDSVLFILKDLVENEISSSERKAILSIEICNHIFHYCRDDACTSFSKNILKDILQENESLFRDNLHLSLGAYGALWENSIEEFLELHGFEGLLYDYSSYLLHNITTGGIGLQTLMTCKSDDALKAIGKSFLKSQYPFSLVTNRLISHNLIPFHHMRHMNQDMDCYSFDAVKKRDSLFGIFCLLACGFEIAELSTTEKSSLKPHLITPEEYDKYMTSEMSDLGPLNYIFKTWSCNGTINKIKEQNEKIGFTEKQSDIIMDWATRKIKLIEKDSN